MDHGALLGRGGAVKILPKIIGRVVFVAFLVGAGGVMAEQGEQREDSDIDGIGELEQEATLSGPDQAAWAQGELERMRGIATRIQGLLAQARRERDLIKITCLNDKLTQINVSIRSFEDRLAQHEEAVRSNTGDRRDHHYRIMVILAQRARALRSEAEACVGESDVVFGETEVETEIDPSITDDDTTEWPVAEVDLLRPPSASGYY
jgi:hypothetical protein